ncbi:hemopexin repeat-containing protein [Maridesulfovibrio sp.]|uniref:hemopexin repeat-containing protein n=1 Tax=Maridesulfovibrio sp. TaxID=2795000 RepID=UPI0029CA2320|nr:hemopexin repeat-containing protein [Maridesulfovibrio sp.]
MKRYCGTRLFFTFAFLFTLFTLTPNTSHALKMDDVSNLINSLADTSGGFNVDAASNWGNNKAYLFNGDLYSRFNIRADRTDSGYPKYLDQNTWPGVPWTDGVDAIVNWGNGKAYLFKDNQYIRYDIRADRADPGYPKYISQNTWPGVPWRYGIDAAVNWGNGKVYLFKGNQYIRYDIRADRADPGYPKYISQNTWPGVPWRNGIDAAVNWGNGKVYIFKGDQYIRYDIRSDRADPGYPKYIDQNSWPGLSF